jgi:hypothetical protein
VVTVTPERILDTRDPNNVGLNGPFVSAVSQKLQVTGSIPTATGTKTVVPAGATGVLLNVTPVGATADGFISIRPGDATGAATTSSLNFTTGDILPNAVQVGVPTAGANAGKIDITFDAYGVAGPTTDILIDVVGYMTSAGLQELVADLPSVAYAGGNQLEGVGTTAEVIRTVTLVPPSDGTVIAQSNVNTDNDAGEQTQCSITTNSTLDSSFNQWAGGGTTANYHMLSGLRGFDAQAGVPLTINLVCRASTGSVTVFDTNLAATFSPTDGAVLLTEALDNESSGGDAG